MQYFIQCSTSVNYAFSLVTISVLFTFITNLCCLFEFERTKRRTTVAIAVVVKVPTEWLGLWFLHRVSAGRYWSEVKLRWREGERRWCCLLRYIWRLERKPIVIRLLLRASKRGLEAKNAKSGNVNGSIRLKIENRFFCY